MNTTLVAAIISAISGLVGVVIGAWLTYETENRALNVKMVEIAIGIVRAKPEDHIKPVRAWAANVIDHYSEVDLSPKARAAIEDNELPFAELRWSNTDADSYTFSTPRGYITFDADEVERRLDR